MRNFFIGYGNLGNLLFQFAYVYSLVAHSDNKDYSINQIPINENRLEYKPTKVGINGGGGVSWI